jgi:hypothetical protein
MRTFAITIFAALAVCISASGQTNSAAPADVSGSTVETLVCIRHAEKPPGGLGQLTCRGLNRALALPNVLLKKYGKPDFIFAPNPSGKADENKYFYVRPLITIEPTAIRCKMPVNTQFGYTDVKGLENFLYQPEYANATVFVAWEHGFLERFAKNIVKSNGGDPAQVPQWTSPDFDSIYVFKLTKSNGHRTISFTVDHENLNGLSDDCP